VLHALRGVRDATSVHGLALVVVITVVRWRRSGLKAAA